MASRRGAACCALLVLLVLPALAQPAEAPDALVESTSTESLPAREAVISRTGETVTIGAGETVKTARLTRGILVVEGTVEGDVQAVESLVTVERGGRVGGGITAAQGSVTVRSGGRVEGDIRVTKGTAVVESGARILGKVEVAGGVRQVEPGAVLGPESQPPGEGKEGGLGGLICLALALWALGTLVGGAVCYSLTNLAALRLEAVSEVLRGHRGPVTSWAVCLLGLLLACALIPCIGWLALIPLAFALAAAAGLGWVGLLHALGTRTLDHHADRLHQVRRGFWLWTLVGLVGIIPCLLPFVLLAKWALLLTSAAAALITDWGRDPEAGGCWPIRRG
jgi:cytoskeletal protein CcmA (bactofilin family)